MERWIRVCLPFSNYTPSYEGQRNGSVRHQLNSIVLTETGRANTTIVSPRCNTGRRDIDQRETDIPLHFSFLKYFRRIYSWARSARISERTGGVEDYNSWVKVAGFCYRHLECAEAELVHVVIRLGGWVIYAVASSVIRETNLLRRQS